MLIGFFQALRDAGLKVSITELLTLCEALQARIAIFSAEDFYYLARATLIKDETQFDRFDMVFANYFKGLGVDLGPEATDIPADWLHKLAEKHLSDEEKARIEALGGWDELMKTLRQRLEEQKERHQGGSKWIGTAGTSPFGAHGYNPMGVRIGQDQSRHRRAAKVWDRREYQNLSADVEINTRTIKMALRKLRRFARTGAALELDLQGTIHGTAQQGGLLDIHMVPERHNAVKVLLLLDIGGSMDDHVRLCERLFSACRSEFKHLEHYYFHNCLYERLWKDNQRRFDAITPTMDVLHKYTSDYRVIIVGDASMNPYEIIAPGASVEHFNDESGETWMRRLIDHFPKTIWINPEPQQRWSFIPSTRILKDLLGGRMYPMTLSGLEEGMQWLRK